ncbi:hypothetical protein Tco_0557444, partial [Tanacetum coccineum]
GVVDGGGGDGGCEEEVVELVAAV